MKLNETFLINGEYIFKNKVRKITPQSFFAADATFYPAIQISFDNGDKEIFVFKSFPEKDGLDTINGKIVARERALNKAADLAYNLFD